MGRRPRLDAPGTYHVTTRGNERAAIVRSDTDRRAFLEQLDSVRLEYGWKIVSYCLMDNHYHLLLKTTVPTLSQGMRQLNGVYAQWFNRRHRRVGHLFQGRFDSRLVQAEEHLLAALAYIVVNPVAAGLCRDPSAWRWSSHRAMLGLDAPGFIDVGTALSYFASDRVSARELYRSLVESAAGRHVGERTRTGEVPACELPRRRQQLPAPPLESLFGTTDADAALVKAVEHGYSLRQIGSHLGLNASTVSRRLRRLRAERTAATAVT